jgi:anti-sigma regulatory factor (Ser/Thr protein kinase)
VTEELSVYRWHHVGALVVAAEGTLGVGTYGRLRDTLLKAAAEAPHAVIVDLDRMGVRSPVALALFPSVASKIAVWPGIPLILVAADDDRNRMLAEYRMRRYVPVHRSIDEAITAIGDPPPRRVARTDLPHDSACSEMARDFVTEWCERWHVSDERTEDALRVVAALVDNTVKHAQGAPTIRIELRRGVFTVAVYDGDPRPARRIEPGTDPVTGTMHGLAVIAHLCRTWGNTPTYTGGKVVWAVV